MEKFLILINQWVQQLHKVELRIAPNLTILT